MLAMCPSVCVFLCVYYVWDFPPPFCEKSHLCIHFSNNWNHYFCAFNVKLAGLPISKGTVEQNLGRKKKIHILIRYAKG